MRKARKKPASKKRSVGKTSKQQGTRKTNTNKKISFFYHYNKPESKRTGTEKISLHFQGKCHIVNNVDIRVPTYGKKRKEQPNFVVAGQANDIKIRNKIAYIT